MNIQNYTKDQLLQAIEKLQLENVSLKSVIKENMAAQKLAEDLKEQTRQNYSSFFNSSQDFLLILDDKGNILQANNTIVKRLEYSKKELLGNPVIMINPPERRDEAADIVANMLEGKIHNCAVPLMSKSGLRIPVESYITTGIWNNKPAFFGVSKDISTSKLSEEKFSKLFSINPSACWVSEINSYTYLAVNKAFCTLLGFESHEVIGETPVSLRILQPEVQKAIAEKVYIQDSVTNFETVLKAKNGDHKQVLLSSESFNVQDKKYRVTVVQDITELRQATKELVKAKEKAEESDQLKTAFLRNISHEIRTPMNAIVGFSNFLNDPNLNKEKQQEFIEIIGQSSNHLLSIISDIINIASIEAGQEKIIKKEFDLNTSLKQLYVEFKKEAKRRNIYLSIEPFLTKETWIISDESKLIQILSKLIGNALKFTTRGYVNFGYTQKETEIEFFVEDTGIGISPELHEEIFKHFRQVETTLTHNYGGSGLGLSISKAYVELLGGKMWVNAQLDKGSTFYFTIPYVTSNDLDVFKGNIYSFQQN